ncbi:hypothetical protein GCM10009720_23510 [Yaniella flava]|uniref:Uncharacterized protein n=1 Tax=Yaniella flava TaxID=287930 RepID=A0ABP5GD65_9MICC
METFNPSLCDGHLMKWRQGQANTVKIYGASKLADSQVLVSQHRIFPYQPHFSEQLECDGSASTGTMRLKD